MYFIDDNPLDYKQGGLKEGGIVRNTAWIRFLRAFRPQTKFITFKFTSRVFKHLNFPLFFLRAIFIRNNTVFFLYPKVGLSILTKGFKGKLFRKAFLSCANMLIRNRNALIFDISDIKYEQAIDLQLDNLDMDEMREFEKTLFSLGQKYIFASHAMRDYAVKQHNIPVENTDVCVNGGFPVEKCELQAYPFIHKDKITCVYAGTLNKGRLIEEMLCAIPDSQRIQLLLLGIGGEWIPEFLADRNIQNVQYLGAFDEAEARKITACCDLGLIPYDNSRLYYNLAYPTKLSFYITAGIPYLSTPVAEVLRVEQDHDLGFSFDLRDWKHFLSFLEADTLAQKKENVLSQREHFLWDNIFDKNRFF